MAINRRIIQIAVSPFVYHDQPFPQVYALADDGTLWHIEDGGNAIDTWKAVVPLPQGTPVYPTNETTVAEPSNG